MSLPLYGATGALFNRLGKLGRVINNINSFQATLETSLTDLTVGVLSQYQTEPDLAAEVGSNWVTMLSSLEQPTGTMQQLTQDTINRMVFEAQPQIGQTYNSPNLNSSLAYIIQQMLSQGTTILQMTVGATTNPFVGVGNGVVNVSLKRPFDGKYLENAFAEVLTFTCTADSYVGGATAYNEQFTVTGEGSQTDVFAYNWPLGSNGSTTINAIDGDTSNGSNNLLTNSGFTNWSGGTPNNWTVGMGATSITQNQSIIFTAGSSLQITGDGSTLVSLNQPFNSSTGTTAALASQNQYSVNIYLRTGGIAPSQGVLQLDLIDGGGTIINDLAGTPNSYTIDLTALGTGWTGFTGSFRMPAALPSTYSLRFHLTTALNNGAVVYLDKLSLGLSTQLYTQGPFVAVHSGSVPFVQTPIADYATASVTNSRGAGGTLSTWQTLLYRLLSSAVGYELIWPSSLSPSISDSLIG